MNRGRDVTEFFACVFIVILLLLVVTLVAQVVGYKISELGYFMGGMVGIVYVYGLYVFMIIRKQKKGELK